MGAHQAKLDDGQYIQVRKSPCRTIQRDLENVATQAPKPEIRKNNTETVMPEINLISVSPPKRIKVANFAKIKTEPQTTKEYSEEDQTQESVIEQELVSLENTTNNIIESNISCTTESELNRSSLLLSPRSNAKENTNNLNLKVKKELLEFQVIEINSKGDQEHFDVTFIINPAVASVENLTLNRNTLKIEPIEDSQINDDLSENNKSKEEIINLEDSFDEVENHNQKNIQNLKLKEEIIDLEYSFVETENHYNQENIQNVKLKEEIIDLEDSFDEVKNRLEQENLKNHKLRQETIELNNSGDGNEEGICEVQPQNNRLVKNPLAFLKKTSENKKSLNHLKVIADNTENNFENRNIKSELISVNSELNAEASKNLVDELTITEVESLQSSINLKELIIKTETLPTTDTYQQESPDNTNLNNNYSNYILNSSLDVNLSNGDTDIDEGISTTSIQEVILNNSNNSTELLKYSNTVVELSSEESECEQETNNIISKDIKKHQNGKIRWPCNLRSIKQWNINKPKQKRGRKPNSKNINKRKHNVKDTSFKTYFPRKNLPKFGIKTRKKINKQNVEKEKFPKPLKLETQKILHKEQNIAIELPKPMMFKSEYGINVKNNKHYLKPKFQPYVRLKRLKSEELLTPLRTKTIRETRSSNNAAAKRDFLIHQAFSLKLNRLSLDHDIYRNEQSSLCSRLTPSYSMPTDTSIDSLAETDSRYFSSRFRNSSTPCEPFVMYGDHIDSGVSSTAYDNHRNLLLEIAAERAFINNHLQYFGHSPVQFNLFNNLNDLNVFLKYLLGNVNMN